MPGTTYTYNTLLAELETWAEDDSAEFIAEIPNIISLAESKVATDLDLEIFHNVQTGALTVGVFEQTVKSAGWCGTRSLWLRDVGGAGPYVQLYRRTVEYCHSFSPDPATARAKPTYFADYNTTQVIVAAAPDVAYAFEHREIALPAAQRLTLSNQNTWLGTNAGELLLMQGQILSQTYLKAVPDDVTIVEKRYADMMPGRKFELRRSVRADYTPVENAAETKR